MAMPIVRPTAPTLSSIALSPSPSTSAIASTSSNGYHVYQVETNSLSSVAAAFYSSAVNQDQGQNQAVTSSPTTQQPALSSTSSATTSSSSGSSIAVSSSEDSNVPKLPLSLAAVICIAVFSTLFIVGICFTCHRLRRRRRDKAKLTGSAGPVGESREKLQSHLGSGEGREERRLTERDLRGVLVPTITTPTAALTSPHSSSSSSSPFTPFPPNSRNAGPSRSLRQSYQYPPPLPRTTNGNRNRQSIATESTFTDHTEYDMLAIDGDSCARTLSTYSYDHSDADGANSEYDQRDLVSGTVAVAAGPSTTIYTSSSSTFDHHTYSSRNEKRSPSSASPSTSGLTPLYPPSAYSQSLSPFNDPPLTSTSWSGNGTHPSWTEEDDQLVLAANAGSSNGSSRTPLSSAGLQRNVTIVRHHDARALQVDNALDNEEEEQVHLPPTYGELYGHT